MTDLLSAATGRKEPSLMVSVGDLSADKHTARLLARLKEMEPRLKIWGLGSSAMRDQGSEILFDCKEFSSIGIFSIAKLLPMFARIQKTLIREIAERQPKAVLLVDFGGFNLTLAKAIKKRFQHLDIFYFISPQVWGSRPWRIQTLKRTVSKIFVIFPFEAKIYERHDIPVRFVGHPLTRNLPDKGALLSREQFCQKYNLAPEKPIIAIFSGSRKSEIKNLLPVVLKACQWLASLRPDVQFALSQANEDLGAKIASRLASYQLDRLRLIDFKDNYSLMSNCDLLWAKSGTTTLEATLFGKPMLVFYRGDWLSYFVFLAFKRVARVSLPNLLAGKALVPELIQLDCRPEQLVKYTMDLLEVPKLQEEISSELLLLRDQLGEGDYATLCAEEIAKSINHQEAIIAT
jgi:lipid-A-disaccharide synthase